MIQRKSTFWHGVKQFQAPFLFCLVLPVRNRHVSQKSEAKLTKRCNVASSIYCLAEIISRRRGKMYLFLYYYFSNFFLTHLTLLKT